MRPLLFSLLVGAFLILTISDGIGILAEMDPKQSCFPGTIPAIKSDLMRTLILCYVYGCPDEVTDLIAQNFNTLHHYDMHPEVLLGDDNSTDTALASKSKDEPPVSTLTKLAKLTSALEKDRIAALTVCTDWMSLLNKLLIDIMQVDVKCFLEPDPKYPPELDSDGAEIDCDEMTVYMKQLQKYFRSQCDSKGENCNAKLKTAVNWFGRAYKQMGRSCYYDAYDYLDN
ncbi:uncharacterized protein LOC131436595 [Malaya genurostris]|uniref:uncharacterized protein LOC131436595 n=1 Tax=Malaya genurostris TaxID=325434 RepID=UPI0026F3EF6D|nr:uncharacterized protein LOC131436595 [Malaya genurostris]